MASSESPRNAQFSASSTTTTPHILSPVTVSSCTMLPTATSTTPLSSLSLMNSSGGGEGDGGGRLFSSSSDCGGL